MILRTQTAISFASLFLLTAACFVSSCTTPIPNNVGPTDMILPPDSFATAPSLLFEAQIPTLEMYADEQQTFDLTRWLRGWGMRVTDISAPDDIQVEWLPQMRPPVTGERFAYGELLGIATPAGTVVGPSIELDRLEARLVRDAGDRIRSLGLLRVTSRPGPSRLVPVVVRVIGEGWSSPRDIVILVRVVSLPRVELSYKPDRSVKRVFVAGSFNGWNSNTDPLTGPDADGVYRTVLRLKPGTYEYKFVVDNEWITDPANPRHSHDGFKNSILEVEGADEAPPATLLSLPSSDSSVLRFAVLGGGRQADAVESWLIVGNSLYPGLPMQKHSGVLLVPRSALREKVADLRLVVKTAGGGWREHLVPREELIQEAAPEELGYHVIYFAMTDRFCDGNPDNNAPIDDPELKPLTNFIGGDFAGLTKKIREGYFDDLGVTAVWISAPNRNTSKAEYDSLPPHRKFSAYHGYWPVAPDETDPHFGTMDELRELVEEARRHGLTILFDFVSNHTHVDHPYYRNHPEWFGQLELPDGRRNIRLFDEHPLTTWFDTFLPSFDFVNSNEALEQVTADALWWLRETGGGGFRHDATKHVPYKFWLRLKERLWEEIEAPQGRRVFQIGETISSREVIRSFVGSEMMNGQFDFPLYWKVRDAFAFENVPLGDLSAEVSRSLDVYGKKARMSPFIGNHDFSRFMACATGAVTPETTAQEKEIGWNQPPTVDNPGDYFKLRLALTFVLTLPGAPLIYYGDEFGMTGAGDPDNRRPMRFGKDLTPAERENLDYTRRLIHVRRRISALWRGDFYPLLEEADTVAYLRSDHFSAAIVVLNRSRRPQSLRLTMPAPLASARWTSVLNDRIYEPVNGVLTVSAAPQSADILRWMPE